MATLLTYLPHVLSGVLLLFLGILLYCFRRKARLLRDAEDRLAESQDHFRLVFEHSGVGMALLSPEGCFLQANPALVQLFGYNIAELSGRRLVDLEHSRTDKGAISGTELGLNIPSGMYEREKRYRCKEGQEVWAHVLRVPLRDAARQLRFIVAVILDITEQRRAKEALAASEQRNRQEHDFIAQVLETADALILVLDRSGRILRFNSKCAAVSGYREEEVRGHVFWDVLVPERSRKLVEGSIAQARDQRIPVGLETPWVTLSGAERLIAWRFTTTKNSLDEPQDVIAAGLDVTEQKKLEEQLRHAQKMETLGTLVGGIAHDFNNQLAIVLGNIRMALTEMPIGSAGRCELIDAEQAGQRCADMTQGLLTFSQRRMGQVSAVDLNHLVVESTRLLQRVLPATIAVAMKTDPELWPVNADRTQLHQLLLNLAVNARDAMTAGGLLTLSTANQVVEQHDCAGKVEWRPGKFVVVSVADTGTGMSPEVSARIFEPFFTTKGPGQGTGLGLAMVFGIVKAHQGWITVTTASGQGSVFQVFLPAATVTVVATEAPTEPVRGGRECILVVDDEDMVCKLARLILERWGFQVLTAANGNEALAVYRQHRAQIDLVLLDFTMPGLTGLQVLSELKKVNPQVRVVFTSGHTMHSDTEELLAAGARAFVAKPYRPEELVGKIRRALDERMPAVTEECIEAAC